MEKTKSKNTSKNTKKKGSRKKGTPSKLMKRISIACAVFVALVGAAILWLWSMTSAKSGNDERERIYVPAGISSDALSDSLTMHFGDKYASKVMRLWGWQGGKIETAEGSYVVEPGTSALSLSRKLLYGRQDPVKVVFNNVRTMEQLAQKVTKRMEMSAEQFLQACDSVLPSAGFDKPNYPAAFMPNTYEFYWNAKPTTVVQTLLDVRNDFWNDQRRAKAKALGLKPAEVATIASIVEEETAKKDEKPMVARLYINRLQKHMRLQADPTVKFALGDFSLRRILGTHLTVDSPYNTYKNIGLPPGPIRIPEGATLDAVLNAPQHDYVFMCAKEDFSGYHNFAKDYATHMQNARRYQAELNKRGIK